MHDIGTKNVDWFPALGQQGTDDTRENGDRQNAGGREIIDHAVSLLSGAAEYLATEILARNVSAEQLVETHRAEMTSPELPGELALLFSSDDGQHASAGLHSVEALAVLQNLPETFLLRPEGGTLSIDSGPVPFVPRTWLGENASKVEEMVNVTLASLPTIVRLGSTTSVSSASYVGMRDDAETNENRTGQVELGQNEIGVSVSSGHQQSLADGRSSTIGTISGAVSDGSNFGSVVSAIDKGQFGPEGSPIGVVEAPSLVSIQTPALEAIALDPSAVAAGGSVSASPVLPTASAHELGNAPAPLTAVHLGALDPLPSPVQEAAETGKENEAGDGAEVSTGTDADPRDSLDNGEHSTTSHDQGPAQEEFTSEQASGADDRTSSADPAADRYAKDPDVDLHYPASPDVLYRGTLGSTYPEALQSEENGLQEPGLSLSFDAHVSFDGLYPTSATEEKSPIDETRGNQTGEQAVDDVEFESAKPTTITGYAGYEDSPMLDVHLVETHAGDQEHHG